jgi:hypothetical protein
MPEKTDLEKLTVNLFSRWDLTPGQQAALKIPGAEGWLLAIHKSLRLLFPRNEGLCYHWVKRRNRDFDNQTPLDVMIREGIAGIKRVCRYLDEERGI